MIKKQLDKYSGQYLTITFKGSDDWKHISELLDEYNNEDEEEEAKSALDELESSYRKEYDLLKSLEVDEISEITSYTSYVVVTIKVKKDDLQHNFSDHYSDLINMSSIDKDTIKILELDKLTKIPNYNIGEALHIYPSLAIDEFETFKRLCDKIGLKTLADVERFMKENGEGKDVITALKDYLINELGIDFHAKDESLKEAYYNDIYFNKILDLETLYNIFDYILNFI